MRAEPKVEPSVEGRPVPHVGVAIAAPDAAELRRVTAQLDEVDRGDA